MAAKQPMAIRLRALIGVLVIVGFAARPASAGRVTDADIDAAITRIKAWLYAQQDPATGGWDDPGWKEVERQPYHATGETALILYALLVSGESYQDPRLTRAIDYLRKHHVESTYLAAMRAHVWAELPDAFGPLLDQEARYLARVEKQGRFFYELGHPTWSNSLTQYGVLGLWEHRKRGGELRPGMWEAVAEHMLTEQSPDGGWRYNNMSMRGGGQSTGSMTAAGVAILQIAQQQLTRTSHRPDPRLTAALHRGMAWLDQRYDPAVNPGLDKQFRYYYLYGIERLALASGVSQLNGRDWFEAGAAFILDQLVVDGNQASIHRAASLDDNSSRIDTAFALAFLARGRVPVWISKLEVPGLAWNNRPNDLYFLTRYLSEQREAELNWQVVPIDSDPMAWLRSPVLYISSDAALELTDPQVANLKRYLDLGGMLLANGEGRGTAFRRSVEALARRMYPHATFKPVAPDSPLATLLTPAPGSAGGASGGGMRTLRNGVRDLIVMPDADWGYVFQATEPSPRGRHNPWVYIANLYATATDRGRLTNRLTDPLPTRDPIREATGPLDVARASYDGRWDVEPAALEIAGIAAFNRSGLELSLREMPLADLGTTTGNMPDLVHLTGIDAVKLSEAQLAAIQTYIGAGGTVLIETVGGLGDFTAALGDQLARHLDSPRQWLDPFSPLISGAGIDGAMDCSRVRYRMFSVIADTPRDHPHLAAIYLGDRPAIILSPRDLSLGALGVRHYQVNGYHPDSARDLLANILLFAASP